MSPNLLYEHVHDENAGKRRVWILIIAILAGLGYFAFQSQTFRRILANRDAVEVRTRPTPYDTTVRPLVVRHVPAPHPAPVVEPTPAYATVARSAPEVASNPGRSRLL